MVKENTRSKTVVHGYDAVFDPELEKKYACPVCLIALRDPVQTKCGHRFCANCLKQSRGKARYGRCPVDNTWFDPAKHIFEDNAVKREVLSLKVKCDNHVDSCEWRGELRDRQAHLGVCPDAKVPCPNACKDEQKRKNLTHHLENCPLRLQACQHCGMEVIATKLTKHQLLACEKFPVTCSVCSETGILRENIPRHVDEKEGDCPLVVVKCNFEDIGCYFQDKRKNMTKHYQSTNLHHLQLLMMKIHQQADVLSRQERQLSEVTDKCTQLTQLTDNLQTMLQDQGNVIKVQATCIQELESSSCFDGRLLWRLHLPNEWSVLTSPPFKTKNSSHDLHLMLHSTDLALEDNDEQFVSVQLRNSMPQNMDGPSRTMKCRCDLTIFDQSGSGNNYKAAFDFSEFGTGGQQTTASLSGKLFRWPYMKDDSLLILASIESTEMNS